MIRIQYICSNCGAFEPYLPSKSSSITCMKCHHNERIPDPTKLVNEGEISMKRLAFVMRGHSDYDDRLWSLLKIYNDQLRVSYSEFYQGYDHVKFMPLMVMAGATIVPLSEDDSEIDAYSVEVEEAKVETFLKQLEKEISDYIKYS